MNKFVSSIIKSFISCLIALSIVSVPTFANTKDFTDYYGRSVLTKLENSKALLYVYDQIVSGVENAESTIYVYKGTTNISVEELKMVFDLYRRDYAHHFWLGNAYDIQLLEVEYIR